MSFADGFDWSMQLEKTVTNSLVTSFGLDFLLFQDKRGGDVDTVHNVRQGVFASAKERDRFDNRKEYDATAYHSDPNYIATGKAHKAAHQAGMLEDDYARGCIARSDDRDVEHTISAKEIHADAGRVLAEKSGVDLANKDSNLNATTSSVNRSKGQKPVKDYLSGLDKAIASKEMQIQKNRERLSGLPQGTPSERHKYRELQDKIKDEETLVNKLKSIDREKMAARDEEARTAYNREINASYYTSSKFLGSTASAATRAGFKMGTRQMLGLVMAELWFELRDQIPSMVAKAKAQAKFMLDSLIQDLKEACRCIMNRLKNRFQDFLAAFRDGAIAGAMTSVTTTLVNIFLTSEKMVVKLIREMWGHLVKALKLIAFNPDQFTPVDLAKAVSEVIAIGLASVIGAVVYAEAQALLQFPFGSELAAFAGALTTGVLTLALQYFLFHSDLMKRVWSFLSSTGQPTLGQQVGLVNAELDRLLMEVARLELEMDLDELADFASALSTCNDEFALNRMLAGETERRMIMLPFEMGAIHSTRKWLIDKAKC